MVEYVVAVSTCGKSLKTGEKYFDVDFHYNDTEMNQIRVTSMNEFACTHKVKLLRYKKKIFEVLRTKELSVAPLLFVSIRNTSLIY